MLSFGKSKKSEGKTEKWILLFKKKRITSFLGGSVYPRIWSVTKEGVARIVVVEKTHLCSLKKSFFESKTFFSFYIPHGPHPTPTIKKESLAKSSWHSSLIYTHFYLQTKGHIVWRKLKLLGFDSATKKKKRAFSKLISCFYVDLRALTAPRLK